MNNSIPLINMRSEFNGITSMLLYSNFNNNGNKDVKRLSFSSHTTDHSEDVISISEDVLKLMEMIFKPVPNYNPRKIVKEI